MSFLSRRNLLGRIGLLLGSAATGILPGSAVLAAVGPPSREPLQNLELYGRNWRLHAPNRVRGELPRYGDRLSMHGTLLDRIDGQEIGQFCSACFCPDSPGRTSMFAAMMLEMHTFTLQEGSIIGMGMGGPTFGQPSRFAIVGGTGRYSGVRGDYSAMQDPVDLSGSGQAEFRFTFLPTDRT